MSTANKLLRQFYGLETLNKEQEARDIDSPHFQARAFFEESVKSDSLPQLLARENSLVSDIRSYDNDLQSLVYDNYSKFLGASDTVRGLAQNISTLHDEMSHLKANLATVARRSDSISDDLETNRQKIQRLVGISRLLGRVEFISKLPAQLRACLKAEKYSAAVNVWTKVEQILSTQQHFPSFRRIHEECSSIMEDIWARIRGQMLNMDVSVSESVEYASLLAKLKTPLSTVCSQLAHHWFLVIDNTLEYGDVAEDPFEALANLRQLAVDDASLFISLYNEKLIPLETNESEKIKVDGIILDFMSNTFERVSQLLPMTTLFNLDCRQIGSYINMFVETMSKIATKQQISKYVHLVLQKYTEAKTNEVYNEYTASLSGLTGMTLYEQATARFIEVCTKLVDDFQLLVMTNYRECSHFLIQQVAMMFGKVFDYFKTNNAENALVYSVIACVFSEQSIPQVFQLLSNLDHDSPLQSLQEKVFADCKSVVSACLKRFVAYKRRITDALIMESMTKCNWRDVSDKPTAPSPMIRKFIEEIHAMNSEIADLLQLTKTQEEDPQLEVMNWQKRSVLKSTSFYQSNNTPTFYGIREEGIHQIDRLFTSVNRLHLSRDLEFDCQSIVASIIMYSLKTMLELVRVGYFSSEGFNQIQVDGYIIYYALNDKVDKQELFAALIDEIISSAGDRAIDPVPLTPHDLAAINTVFEKSII